MNISINEKVLRKYDLTLNEFLVLFLCSREADIEKTIETLIDKKIVDKDLYNKVSAVVSDNTKELISSIIIDSGPSVIGKEEEFNDLANKMRELFPEGRKPGTTYYWRDSTPIIAKKLKTVVEKFNTQFTEEQALDATRRYVESFNGDYRFMQLLKYFILKTDKATGDVRSDFLSLLQKENILSATQLTVLSNSDLTFETPNLMNP